MKKNKIIERLMNPGLVPVIRLDSGEKLNALLNAFLRGGITAAELTMTIPGAVDLLQKAKTVFGDSLLLGMGTVVDKQMAEDAIAAGADFLISPFPVPEVIQTANAGNVTMIAGAFTPYEVFQAHSMGADFVKVFPLNVCGINYLKDLKGPLPKVKFFPTGGITLEQIGKVLSLASGCGVGGALVRQDLIKAENWDALTDLARKFVDEARKVNLSAN